MKRIERAVDAMLRSRGARYVGWALGLLALAFLAQSLVRSGEEAMRWLTATSAGRLTVSIMAFALYQAGLMVTLRLLFARPTNRIWGITQLVKYLPVPGSAAIGMVGTTVRGGGTSREGVELLVRHTLVHMGAATALGAPATAELVHRWLGLHEAITIALAVLAGLAVAVLSVRGLPLARGAVVVVLSLATWAVFGVLLWWGVALGQGPWLLVSTAFAAGWVAGQIAIPVPAGIGVRELVLVLLLSAHLGDVGALSFALGTRVLHVISDAVVAGLVIGGDGWRTVRAVASRAGHGA